MFSLVFKFESLRYAIEQVKITIADSKMQSDFQQLFDDCLEPGDRKSRKRGGTERVTRTSRRKKPTSESSDESSSEEVGSFNFF